MRVMIKFTFPVEFGNDAIKSGRVEKVIGQIVDELKPEAAYFFPQDGDRGGFIIVNMADSSEIVQIAERFFLGLNAKVALIPVMAAEDLKKGLASMPGIAQRYA